MTLRANWTADGVDAFTALAIGLAPLVIGASSDSAAATEGTMEESDGA
jgi:hypothetical protein